MNRRGLLPLTAKPQRHQEQQSQPQQSSSQPPPPQAPPPPSQAQAPQYPNGFKPWKGPPPSNGRGGGAGDSGGNRSPPPPPGPVRWLRLVDEDGMTEKAFEDRVAGLRVRVYMYICIYIYTYIYLTPTPKQYITGSHPSGAGGPSARCAGIPPAAGRSPHDGVQRGVWLRGGERGLGNSVAGQGCVFGVICVCMHVYNLVCMNQPHLNRCTHQTTTRC